MNKQQSSGMIVPMPQYFIIRVPKKEQDDRREKVGSLYLHFQHIFMTRECQAGEIVAIGSQASKIFPEARNGHMLIHHHFVSGKEAEGTDEGRYMIFDNPTHRYYTVTCRSYAGRQNETYGVYDGEKIIPHPDYVFLESSKVKEFADPDLNQQLKKTPSGILLFDSWAESRETTTSKMETIKMRVQELAKNVDPQTGQMRDDVRRVIEGLEAEMDAMSKKTNKRLYITNTVAASQNKDMPVGAVVYSLNLASKTEIEFMNRKYIVVKQQYISSKASNIG